MNLDCNDYIWAPGDRQASQKKQAYCAITFELQNLPS